MPVMSNHYEHLLSLGVIKLLQSPCQLRPGRLVEYPKPNAVDIQPAVAMCELEAEKEKENGKVTMAGSSVALG